MTSADYIVVDGKGFDVIVSPEEMKAKLHAQYGENKKIVDGAYDEALAVKCINGTFVGKKEDGIVTYKGIPFVAEQPVGKLRWKAPVAYVEDDGVYEAFYNGKSPYQLENVSEKGSLYVQGEDCLYLDIWKADDDSCEKKPVMVFDEDNIHSEREREREILDWERTYFLTKYYCI